MTGSSFLMSPVPIFVVGYLDGTVTDVATEYVVITLTVGLAAGGGILVGVLVVGLLVVVPEEGLGALGLLIPGTVTGFLQVVNGAITGLAGAAVGHLRTQ